MCYVVEIAYIVGSLTCRWCRFCCRLRRGRRRSKVCEREQQVESETAAQSNDVQQSAVVGVGARFRANSLSRCVRTWRVVATGQSDRSSCPGQFHTHHACTSQRCQATVYVCSLYSTVCLKNVPPFNFLNNSVKTESISIIFRVQISCGNFSPENYKPSHLAWIMSPHYLVKHKSSCLQYIIVISII